MFVNNEPVVIVMKIAWEVIIVIVSLYEFETKRTKKPGTNPTCPLQD